MSSNGMQVNLSGIRSDIDMWQSISAELRQQTQAATNLGWASGYMSMLPGAAAAGQAYGQTQKWLADLLWQGAANATDFAEKIALSQYQYDQDDHDHACDVQRAGDGR